MNESGIAKLKAKVERLRRKEEKIAEKADDFVTGTHILTCAYCDCPKEYKVSKAVIQVKCEFCCAGIYWRHTTYNPDYVADYTKEIQEADRKKVRENLLSDPENVPTGYFWCSHLGVARKRISKECNNCQDKCEEWKLRNLQRQVREAAREVNQKRKRLGL